MSKKIFYQPKIHYNKNNHIEIFMVNETKMCSPMMCTKLWRILYVTESYAVFSCQWRNFTHTHTRTRGKAQVYTPPHNLIYIWTLHNANLSRIYHFWCQRRVFTLDTSTDVFVVVNSFLQKVGFCFHYNKFF